MSKELEALYNIIDEFISQSMYSTKEASDALDSLYTLAVKKQSLTPPTADEIVEDLNELEYGKWELKEISDNLWGFVAHDNELNIDWYVANDNYGFTTNITCSIKLAHKITSFFMNLEVK